VEVEERFDVELELGGWVSRRRKRKTEVLRKS